MDRKFSQKPATLSVPLLFLIPWENIVKKNTKKDSTPVFPPYSLQFIIHTQSIIDNLKTTFLKNHP